MGKHELFFNLLYFCNTKVSRNPAAFSPITICYFEIILKTLISKTGPGDGLFQLITDLAERGLFSIGTIVFNNTLMRSSSPFVDATTGGKIMCRKKLLSSAAALAIMVGLSASVPVRAGMDDNWTGLYVGGFVGPEVAKFSGRHQAGASAAFAPDLADFAGGLLASFNYQLNSYVVGVEADYSWNNMKEFITTASPGAGGIKDEVDLLASIRARLGFLPEDNLLIYTTVGIGFIDATHSVQSSGGTTARFSLNDTGFVVGGGLEWQPEDSYFTFRVQGLYYFFGEKKDTFAARIGSAAPGDYGKVNDAYTVTAGITLDLSRIFGNLTGGGP